MLQSSLRNIKGVPDDMQRIGDTVNALVRKVPVVQSEERRRASLNFDSLLITESSDYGQKSSRGNHTQGCPEAGSARVSCDSAVSSANAFNLGLTVSYHHMPLSTDLPQWIQRIGWYMIIFSSLITKVSAAVFLCDTTEQVFNRECFRLRTGIWTRSLKQKTGLHQNIISRAIKTLEQKKLIKNVKSVKVGYARNPH